MKIPSKELNLYLKFFNLSKDIEMEYHMHVIHFTIDFKFLFLNIVSWCILWKNVRIIKDIMDV